jgi:integrase
MRKSKKIGPLIGPSLDTFSIIFLLKRKKKNKQKMFPIYSRVTINGERIELSTKRSILLKNWDKKSQRPKLKTKELKVLNYHLEQIRNKFYVEHQKLVQKGSPLSAMDLKNAYLNIKAKGKGIITMVETHNIDMENQIPDNYSAGTLKNYRTLKKHLSSFIPKEYKKVDLELKRVDRNFIYSFERYLLSNPLCNQNGAMKVLQRFKKITTLSKRKGLIDDDPFEGYRFVFKRKEIEFLTADEIDRLSALDLKIPSEIKTQELFVFALYTGLAYSDIISLKWHQIHSDKEGSQFIFNKRKKTGETFIVPLLKPALEILDSKTKIEDGLVFDSISNAYVNRKLKILSQKAQIFKNITFHIARHSFATTITLNNDVPLITVSKMLGHSNTRTTQIYAKVLQKKVSSDMEKLNKKLFD